MEQRLCSSPTYLQQMERAHKSYGKQRWALLTKEDQENVLQRGWGDALSEKRGVAGIRGGRWNSVKCLHAHAAHYLAQVAEWEEEQKNGGKANIKLRGSTELKEGIDMGIVTTSLRECDRNDLNLVGKWTMDVVLDAMKSGDAPIEESLSL